MLLLSIAAAAALVPITILALVLPAFLLEDEPSRPSYETEGAE